MQSKDIVILCSEDRVNIGIGIDNNLSQESFEQIIEKAGSGSNIIKLILSVELFPKENIKLSDI